MRKFRNKAINERLPAIMCHTRALFAALVFLYFNINFLYFYINFLILIKDTSASLCVVDGETFM